MSPDHMSQKDVKGFRIMISYYMLTVYNIYHFQNKLNFM